MAHKFPRITVTWADHHITPTNEVISLEELQSYLEPSVRETTGYLVAETRRVLAVAGTVEDDGSFCEVNVLMKKAVLRKEIL